MPFLGHETYYRIVGEASDKAPLLLLHGGPGSTHNYFEVLDCMADTGRQVISYDQIGCGNSYLDGHPEMWTLKTWIDELIALRDRLAEQYTDCDVELQAGGQPLYYYLIAVE